ncbi:MAG: arylesterase [Croceibacterium sp.]
MRLGRMMVSGALLLAGCNGNAPAEQPVPSARMTAAAEAVVAGPERRVLAFGDSLFAGYRLGRKQGYPERLEAALRRRGLNARVINAGVSGDTTAAGRQRFGFVLGSLAGPPALAIVELGGNDLLRAIPPAETRANLAAILAELKRREIPFVLMGMRAPPNMGPDYVAAFNGLYPALAKEYGGTLVPFFQATVFDRPQLLQADHVHPTALGVEALVAGSIERVIGALPPSS